MKGNVYKIICVLDHSILYIGSTFNEIRHRWQQHVSMYKKWLADKSKKKCSIFLFFDKYGVENFKMLLIKSYEVTDKDHLHSYEQEWIDKENCVNIKAAFITPENARIKKNTQNKKWCNLNKDEIAKKKKIYNANPDNKAKRNDRLKEKVVCECGMEMNKGSLSKHRKRQVHIKRMKAKSD